MQISPLIIDDLSWLPEPSLRKFALYPGEVDVMRAKPKRTVSEYVHGERYVHVSPLPGPLDLDIAPYTRGIMDAFSEEHVREIFLCGGSQGAKTDTMHNCWAWAAVHAPRPALIVMQDRVTGSETISDRFIPMIEDTPSLRRLRTKNPDDLSNKRVRLKNGMVTYLAWGKSEGRLASKPICYLFMDEVDLYPPAAIKKARARTRAFRHERKIVEACTASTNDGRIWQAQFHAQEIRDYYVQCPHCGQYQTMKFEGIRWEEGIVDPQEVSDKGSAWYECEECRNPWDEDDRDEAVRHGEWRARPGKVRHLRPSSIWFHIPPMLSRFVFFNEIASSYLLTLTEPTEENFRNHYNDNLGFPVPVTDENEAVQEKEMYGRRKNYAPEGADWRIPMAACVVTADVDVQANRLECEVVAWGPGHESWGIEYKVFHGKPQEDQVWEQLHEYLQETRWKHESGVDLAVTLAGVDIGYCADQVSKFVRRSKRYVAHKGSNLRGLPLVPRKPSKGKYKVSFYELGTDTGKDTLFTWLNNEEGPRSCHFPIGFGYDFEYFRMLCSEHGKKEKDKRTQKMVTVWQLRPGFSRNEALDIRVGNMAVRAILNPVYDKLSAYLQAQMEKPKEQPAQPAKEKKTKSRKRAVGGFVSKWNSRGRG